MTARSVSALRVAAAVAVVSAVGGARATEPGPGPQPIAPDTPAFRAPAEPPRPGAEDAVPPAEAEGPLTLEAALALALAESPELSGWSWAARAKEAHELQAGRIPNPEVEVRLVHRERPAPDDDEARQRVIVSQVFEIGGKRERRVALAASERELAEWDYEAARTEVATAVAARFAAVLGAQRRADSSRQFVEFLERTRSKIQALVDNGSMRVLELHQVARQLGLARIERQEAEASLAAARFLLAATWGGTSPRFTAAVGDLEPVPPVPGLDTVFELARHGPALARWDSELEHGAAALALARAGRVPDLTYGVGVRWNDQPSTRDYLVDLEIALPIFDRKRHEIRQARYDLARAQAERRAAEAGSSAAIAAAYYRLVESRARCATLADEVLPAARSTFDALAVGFERQASDVGDLLDARRDLARAEADHAAALVAHRQAWAELEALVGQGLAGE